MAGFIDKAKNAYKLQKEAKAIKEELKKTHIEAEEGGITVTVTGEQEIVSISIPDDKWNELKNAEFGKKHVETSVLRAVNKGVKKAQEIGSERMKGVFNQLGMM